MNRDAAEDPPAEPGVTPLRRAARGALLGVTLLFVLAALAVSVSLLIYTAWSHDFERGLFALAFSVLSAQIALNWLLWREDEE